MIVSTLVDEIADWIQQDTTTAVTIWSEDNIKAAIKQAVEEFSLLLLKDALVEDVEYSSTELSLPSNYISCFRVSKDGVTVPIIDLQKISLAGLTNPFSTAGTSKYVVEVFNSSGDKVIRVLPPVVGTTAEFDIWHKAKINFFSSDAEIVELSDWFIPILKLRIMGILYGQDTSGRDSSRSEFFTTLYNTFIDVLRVLFPMGSEIR